MPKEKDRLSRSIRLLISLSLLILFSLSGLWEGFLFAAENSSGSGIRRSVLAGSWYPASPDQLRETIQKYLDAVPPRSDAGDLVALISPHAGYIYSGQVAAHAYKLLTNRTFRTVVVIAPSHRTRFDGVSVYDRGGYETPLGVVPLDHDIIRCLKEGSSKIQYIPEAHAREHALEIQLPFLQVGLRDFKLVPLIMGEQSFSNCQFLAEKLAECIRGKSVLIVASSDLSHFHPYEQAKSLDQVVIRHVSRFDPQALSYDLARGTCEACGGGPMITAMLAAKLLNANRAEVLDYANSGDVTGDHGSVVGYLAAAFWRKANQGQPMEKRPKKIGTDLGLNEKEKQLLHRIAKESITARCKGHKMPALEIGSQRLKEPHGAFVTLHKNGRLRGCIGHIVGDRPLAETVARMAVAAAFEDPRFPPVTEEELNDLDIEISVLTPLKPIERLEDIQVGKHGILVQRNGASGLLLPQVATECGWDRITFLEQTCRKAGLPKDAWKDKKTKIYIFSADVF